MPRRKITRSSKEELDLQRKRHKNNKNIINIAGTIHDNRITELNEENSLDVTLVHNKSLALIEYEMIE